MSNERMTNVMIKLMNTSFYRMPASANHHSNRTGGLLEHSLRVWHNLEMYTKSLGLKWKDPSSPFVVAMLHDACKIDAYFYNHDYGVWERDNKPKEEEEHGVLSLKKIEELGITLTDEEKACIRWHMGAFDKRENWAGFNEAMNEYPNVFWTHVSDMVATNFDETIDRGNKCCICGKPLTGYGNNPWPVRDAGKCCDFCNLNRVIPARLIQYEKGENS